MDPFRQRCYIYIGAGKHDLCPVCTLTQYLHVRGSTPGPLFLLSDGTPLHRQWLTSNIQSIFSAAGDPGCYTGHSFRIGAATSAASRGLPDHLIKTLGRWSSDAYQIYIHTPVSTIVGVASLLTWQVFSCVSFSFPSCPCRVPRDLGSSGPGLPPALSPSFALRSGCVSSESPFGLEWGLMAGLRGFASHGGSFLSRGWLATVEAPGYPRHPPST